MNRYHVTYRYSNPRAAISHVIATMVLRANMTAAELIEIVECADKKLRVFGIEVAA